MTSINIMQSEMAFMLSELEHIERHTRLLLAQFSVDSTWKTKTNENFHKKISKLNKQHIKLREQIIIKSSIIKTHIDAEKKFKKFLEPIIEAGYVVYDDGEYAYTAQQIQFMKLHNEFADGYFFHEPILYEKANEFFCHNRVSLKSKILPGNLELLSDDYKKYIATYSDLRDHCFGRTYPLKVTSKNEFHNTF